MKKVGKVVKIFPKANMYESYLILVNYTNNNRNVVYPWQ